MPTLAPRRTVPVQPPVRVGLDVVPTLGMLTSTPPDLPYRGAEHTYPLGASPDMVNCVVLNGVLQKRPGYAQYQSGNTAFGSAVVGLYSTQDESNNTHLYAVFLTGVKKYNSATLDWDACTGPALTGGATQLFTFETSQNSVVFSQGLDQVMRVPFTTTYAVLNANCPAARYLVRAADRLIVAYTLESAVPQPWRVRRSVQSDHTDWTGLGSGFTDLSEFPYHVRNLKKLGARLAVYTERSIWHAQRTGLAAAPLRFDIFAADAGLYAAHTLRGDDTGHYLLGNKDVFLNNGSTLTPIADPVRDTIFTTLNAAAFPSMFAELLYDTQEYILFVCTGASTAPDTAWVFNRARGIVYKWTVSGPLCSSLHRLDDTSTWDGGVGTWDEQLYEWDSRGLQAAYPAMLTGHADGKVYRWGTQYVSDAGAAIACRWTSKDFTASDLGGRPGQMITLQRLLYEYTDTGADTDLLFSFSVNGGESWDSPLTSSIVAGTGGIKGKAVDRQVTGSRIRFRVEQSSATQSFKLNKFMPQFELREQIVTA